MDEIVYETEAFLRSMYLLGLLKGLKNKVVNILNKVHSEHKVKKNDLIIPYVRSVESVSNYLKTIGICAAHASCQRLSD